MKTPSSQLRSTALAALMLITASSKLLGMELQGQDKGNTNTWSTVNLQGWLELDYIPFRVYFASGSAGTYNVELDFPHLSGTTPGFEDLTSFTAYSPNVKFTSPPLLHTAPSGTWYYTFTVQVTNNNAGEVRFFARLAAGAHLNPGSSLHLSGNAGLVQIHKPGPGPGAPNLAIVKSGPGTASAGNTITYTLTYTNKSATDVGVGSQLSDILPTNVSVIPASLSTNAHIVGNTIFWDLPNVVGRTGGKVTFQVQISPAVLGGTVITNFSQILSSENDADMSDNTSTWLTTVTSGCVPPIGSVTGNTNLCPGSPLTMTANATGTSPFTYQWRHNGANVSGATASTYSVAAVSANDAGPYDVLLGNICGSSTSSPVAVSLKTPISATPLTNVTTCAGMSVTFSTVASGTGPFTYLWRKDGTLLTNQAASALTIASVSSANAGVYSVEVSGACGTVTNSATLIVNQPVVIVSALTNQTACPANNILFAVGATGTSLSYQWYKNSAIISGQTGNTLSLNSVSNVSAGTYSVVVSGACGNPITNSAVLTVNQNVVITGALTNQTVCPGNNVTFTIGATGTSLSYQWYKDNAILTGQTGNALSLSSVSNANAGTYSIVVTGACGNPITNSAVLTVNQNVVITGALTNQTVCSGNDVILAVGATGTSLSFQWYKGTTALASQTTSTLSLTSVSNANGGTYSVVVSGACGNAITNTAVLTVNQTVAVTGGLTNQTACPGNNVTFTIGATGTSLAYQWYKDSAILTGQSGSTLSLNSVSNVNAGTYSVVITGACGNPITNSAVLTVNQNVVITGALTNQTVCQGNNVTLAIGATGTSLSFQWYKGTMALAGQTASTLSLTSVSNANGGTYSVVVSGACGNAITNSAVLTVNQAVAVAGGLTNQTVCPGNNVTFTIGATGTSLAYQWYKDSAILTGQSGSTLSLNSVSNVNAGTYSVVVTGACGNPITNSAALTVNQDVVITGALTNQTVCQGNNATLAIGATGTSLSYQWYKGTTALAGQTASSLSITSVSNANGGTYAVVVSGTCGTATTNSAVLTVNQSLVIGTALTNQTVCPGINVTFTIGATGTSLTYQWYKDNAILTGQTANTLSLNSVSNVNAGTYSVVVSGACGNPVTNSAALTVNQNVVITGALTNQTACQGNNVTFAIGATGTSLSYQWYKGTTALAGQTASSLSFTSVSNANAGTYAVVVSGTCGPAITNSAVLTVNQNLVISAALTNQTVCPGNNVTFTIGATGTSLSYQWYKDNAILTGQTANTLALNSVSNLNAGTYSVIVSGACGNPITNSAVLTVNQNVVITGALTNQTVCSGNDVILAVGATGTSLSYQWYKGTTALAGQTASSLSFTSVSNANSGAYAVVASGTCGTAITNSATLTVNQNLVIGTALTNQTVCPGNDVIFAIGATGTSLTYQWYKDNAILTGQTGNTLSLNSVSNVNAGTYSVVVTGACGNPITNSAALTVNQNVVITGALTNQTVCQGNNVTLAIGATGTSLSYQWYKGTTALTGQTTSSLSFTSVSNANGGTYAVVVSGTCGPAITNSATLTVNQNLVISTALTNQTVCPGNDVTFTIGATGTSLTYQWYKDNAILTSQTANTLSLNSVSNLNAGTYSVVITGACGNPVTNSAILTVNLAATASALPDLSRGAGATVTFGTTASGSGTLTYVWKFNGAIIPGATNNSLTITNISSANAGTYTVEVTGACGTAIATGSLTLNSPPTISIYTPTNGTVFIAPATFTIAANAYDADGFVTNVTFYSFGTNKLGDTTNSLPAVIFQTNVPLGNYTYTAVATDNLGARGTSAPVSIQVIAEPPLTVISAIHLDLQTGLFIEKVRVFNPTPDSASAARVYISNLNSSTTVHNASGTTNGVPYVQSHDPVPAGGFVDLTIEYADPFRITPNPTLHAALVLPEQGGGAAVEGIVQPINRVLMLPDHTFLIEFLSQSNRVYYIEYSSDMITWKTAQPALTGTGTYIQWIDNGQPKTESAPSTVPVRYYRLVMLP